jgi:hypothetical protein
MEVMRWSSALLVNMHMYPSTNTPLHLCFATLGEVGRKKFYFLVLFLFLWFNPLVLHEDHVPSIIVAKKLHDACNERESLGFQTCIMCGPSRRNRHWQSTATICIDLKYNNRSSFSSSSWRSWR